ncbi:hypothetical protein [Streptomyces brasiliensis]|uniref:Uncharacterized protein n=1 Tax=Streptomyces brasiliensis TaxID=1954 RepID=A0A917L729_9ACTN|nr:hypothetical protein [Streptomyces brasiliensis]GGJ43680.1 hypothetical protein GCM10010121_063650 [Streptomyces brasiliensis]
MSTPPRPSLKSVSATPDGPDAARWTAPRPIVGGPKGAARKGVVTAFLPDRSPAPDADPAPSPDPTPDHPGIRVYAPPVYRDHWDGARWSKRYGDTPRAAYACTCGQTGTATGQRAVAALVAEYDAHKSACTGTPAPLPERRNAA